MNQTVLVLKNALYDYANQVDCFCQQDLVSKEHKAKSLRLIKQFRHLINCARGKPALVAAMNLEQLEAKADRLFWQINDK